MKKMVSTTHCQLAVSMASSELENGAPIAAMPLLFIHGNSSCKEVFKQQIAELSNEYPCISIDLPGHGKSQDAINPVTTYCMSGYADAVLQAMAVLGVADFYVVGWSLGGHIGIEMMSQSSAVKGLLISGTPPIGHDGADQKHFVETDPRPVAVINGQDDPMINNQYLLSLNFKNLSGGKVHLLPNSGHAPFWESPVQFNKLLRECVKAIS